MATLKIFTVLLLLHSGGSGADPSVLSRKLPPFGRQMREEFHWEPGFTQLNHGAFGNIPRVVSKSLHAYQDRSERNPDLWLRQDLKIELKRVRKMLGEIINANPDDLLMLNSGTTSLNTVIQGIKYNHKGERILYFSTAYRGVDFIVQFIIDHRDKTISKLIFNLTFPISNEEFLQNFETFLNENHDPKHPIRLAVFDHIGAVPAVIYPLEYLIPMMKRRNITVFVDGAHAIGQIPINLTALDPDFYFADCHKWLFAARGCAVLYVNKKHQDFIHPRCITAAYKTGFQAEFFWQGTIDYSPYMTVPTAIQFRLDAGGEDAIMNYNHNLAWEGGRLMASRLGTRILQSKDQLGSMVDVQLPLNNPNDGRLDVTWWVKEQLHKYPDMFVRVYKYEGYWWARVSTQIYNDISDFEACVQHVLSICNELNASPPHPPTDKTLVLNML